MGGAALGVGPWVQEPRCVVLGVGRGAPRTLGRAMETWDPTACLAWILRHVQLDSPAPPIAALCLGFPICEWSYAACPVGCPSSAWPMDGGLVGAACLLTGCPRLKGVGGPGCAADFHLKV